MDKIKDFSSVKNFPGTLDNEFDIILRRLDDIQKINPIIFASIFILLSLIVGYGRWSFSILFAGFIFTDWLLLSLLPKFHLSFGPPKPPALILALLRAPFALLPSPAALILQIIGTFLVIYGFWIEPHRLRITRQRLETEKLPEGFSFTLLHLGDLHIERITRREIDLNQSIKELAPDLILFSGDVLNLSYVEDPTAIEHARQIIGEWQAPMGTYGVSGSEAVDLDHVFPDLVHDLPMRWLSMDTLSLVKDGVAVNLTGLNCSHRPFRDAPILATLAGQAKDAFSILLYHSPDLAPDAAKLGFDLQLSGHTHGGQVCIPWYGPIFTASLYGRLFQSGRYTIGNMQLYITRGIGMEGKAAPRIRFLCPPEMILWEIVGTGAKVARA